MAGKKIFFPATFLGAVRLFGLGHVGAGFSSAGFSLRFVPVDVGAGFSLRFVPVDVGAGFSLRFVPRAG